MTRLLEFLRRSLTEFLATPTIVIVGFLLLTAGMYWLDRSNLPPFVGLSDTMGQLIFSTHDSTRALLGTLAASLVTITSITFSLLLIALQQAAASMTPAIIDQFLRRRSNQVFFGFFVGLALYALIILSATSPDFNPILSASLALLLGMVSLYLLIILIYSTIHQVRPAVVVEAIHNHTLTARERQLHMLRRTHPQATRSDVSAAVRCDDDGFVVGIDLDALAGPLEGHDDAELEVSAGIGAYVSFGDVLAEVRGADLDVDGLNRIRGAFVLERVRDLDNDPSFGIEEMVNIAWTSISTSKQSPGPGRLVILALRDLLARWSAPSDDEPASGAAVPVAYRDDLVAEALDALELMGVVCSESMQAQNAATVIESLAVLHPRLDAAAQHRVADVGMRLLAGLGDHVLTAPLEAALGRLADVLAATHPTEALSVRQAVALLRRSNGLLNSRATRVPTG